MTQFALYRSMGMAFALVDSENIITTVMEHAFMKSITYPVNNALIIYLEEELDARQVTVLSSDFERISETDYDVLIDMTELFYVDSSGFAALVYLYKRLLERGRRLSILNVHGQPKDLFEMLHLDKMIHCHHSIREFLDVQRQHQPAFNFALDPGVMQLPQEQWVRVAE